MNNELILDSKSIKSKIYTIRGLQVMIDCDLAEIYGVETKVFNQAVKRNIERFPESFRFQLTKEEAENLRCQIGTSSGKGPLRSQIVTSSLKDHGGRRYLPFVFTEQGVSMLSAVLRSKTAIEVSIRIINAFVQMRHFIRDNAEIFARLDSVDRRQVSFESETARNFEKIFDAIESREIKPKQGIFFDGQVFDAYIFVSDLIKSAETSIILIDNYVDETVLTLISKRNRKCRAVIYTKNISKKLELDLKKHNQQYPEIDIHIFTKTHDRFLILDEKEIYHIGASLKDLGKKWFAFSKFESSTLDLLSKLKNIRK